jgi:hypothetical protein
MVALNYTIEKNLGKSPKKFNLPKIVSNKWKKFNCQLWQLNFFKQTKKFNCQLWWLKTLGCQSWKLKVGNQIECFNHHNVHNDQMTLFLVAFSYFLGSLTLFWPRLTLSWPYIHVTLGYVCIQMCPSRHDECTNTMATLEVAFILCEMSKCALWNFFASESIALVNQLANLDSWPKIK